MSRHPASSIPIWTALKFWFWNLTELTIQNFGLFLKICSAMHKKVSDSQPRTTPETVTHPTDWKTQRAEVKKMWKCRKGKKISGKRDTWTGTCQLHPYFHGKTQPSDLPKLGVSKYFSQKVLLAFVSFRHSFRFLQKFWFLRRRHLRRQAASGYGAAKTKCLAFVFVCRRNRLKTCKKRSKTHENSKKRLKTTTAENQRKMAKIDDKNRPKTTENKFEFEAIAYAAKIRNLFCDYD